MRGLDPTTWVYGLRCGVQGLRCEITKRASMAVTALQTSPADMASERLLATNIALIPVLGSGAMWLRASGLCVGRVGI